MTKVIASIPTSFRVSPYQDRWFHWRDIANCFWPGRGRRATIVNPTLAPVRHIGGVYCFAWSAQPPSVIAPTEITVHYIGQTGEFKSRMGQFGNSAGFWGERQNGHSAGWRWPKGQFHNAWIGFFPIGNDLVPHLATGMRHWMEAVALEEFRLVHGHLPAINAAATELTSFKIL